ncbi:flavin reductase [Leucobacter sp. USHLN153]|uniref:flavin reductase n=1 Tax=Leucobacter sp. USHLN153 TaxID=3081268 RepID=UPI00301A201A
MPEHEELVINPEMYRAVLGQYPTGVAAITGIDPDGAPIAMIVGSFSSVSLDPPLVSFMPMQTSGSYARLRTAKVLCANVLSMAQQDVCRALASRGEDKFQGVAWTLSPGGAPIIDGASAWIEFAVEQTVEAGDHDIVIGRVSELGVGDGGLPLLFLGGGYGRYSANSRIMPATVDSVDFIRWAEAVKPELEQLSRELGLEAVFVSLIDDAIVQVATYGAAAAGARPHPLGVRLPFGAPMGALFAASASERARSGWLQRSLPGIEQDAIDRHAAALDRVRDRGWSISLRTESLQETDRTLRARDDGQLTWGQVPLAPELVEPDAYGAEIPEDADAALAIRNLSSAVHGPDGLPLFYVTLFGFGETTSAAELARILERLQRATGEAGRIVAGS